PLLHPSEIKGIIARLDWFCGTRMHSTIAGLSSGVPTAAIAYSGKTRGVFESCGQGERVADPRKLDTDATVEHLLASFRSREESRAGLKRALPSVLRQAREQMEEIAAFCAPITA
ncbi:MAG: polysaccharide pyruvyl transferase family protein, partial [Planctomycetota bacterium]